MRPQTPTAILLAGLCIAAAIAWQGRSRVIPISNGYVWEDRWTGSIAVCTAFIVADDGRSPWTWSWGIPTTPSHHCEAIAGGRL